MIDIDLRAHLLNNADIGDLVGTGIYALRLPQGTATTAIVYDVSNGFAEPQIGSLETVIRHTVTLHVYSPSYVVMRQLTSYIINTMSGMKGVMGTTRVSGSYVDSNFNTYEEEQQLYRSIINLTIHTY